MCWFRTKRQLGAHLALIAVLLQLSLTFGHVHTPPSLALSSEVQSSQSNGTAPQDSNHNGRAGSDCPTCALIQLSAISAPSVAPQLPLPWTINFVTLHPYTELALTPASQASFQARAPPAA